MMSMIPVMLVISQILAFIFKEDLRQVVRQLLQETGSESLPGKLEHFIIGGGSDSISIFFVIIAMWAASKAQFSMIRIANYTLTGGEGVVTGFSGFLKDRLRAYSMMFFFILILTFTIVIIIYAEFVLNGIFSFLGVKVSGADIWLILRWPVSLVLYFLNISFLYYIMPTQKLRYRYIIPGSLFASAGVLIVTYGYNLYVSGLANYNVLYGSLATVIAMLIWFYMIGWVFTLGLVFTNAWIKTGGIDAEKKKK